MLYPRLTMNDAELDTLRPLELRVRHPATPGFSAGITERDAQRFGRAAADALLVARVLFNQDGGMNVHVAAVNGHAPELAVSPSALFHLWVSLTAHVARTPLDADDVQANQQVQFLRRVLLLMSLDEDLQKIAQEEAAATGGEAPDSLPAQDLASP